MKELHFEYTMKLNFDPPVSRHRFTLKCVPHTSRRQEINDVCIDVYPKEFLSWDEDSFGNSCIYGYSAGEHDHFSVSVTGRAKTGLASYEDGAKPYQVGSYKYQTDYTMPGPNLRSYAETFHFAEDTANLDKALAYMDGIYGRFSYVQGVTGVCTTAEEAFTLGKGVCQDYAHILLSLCRTQNIPCRYVVGMLLGEGLSHAWVEVYSDEKWIGLDPTNHLIVDDQHIRISGGRDYKDCTINQGIFVGNTVQTQEAKVSVWETK